MPFQEGFDLLRALFKRYGLRQRTGPQTLTAAVGGLLWLSVMILLMAALSIPG
jgi:hypothetical protein